MFRDVFWTPVEDTGLEHLQLTEDRAGVAAESAVMRANDGKPFRILYQIDCDRSWRTRRVHVATLGGHSQSMTLRADGDGTWIDEQGSELSVLERAIDVDISATPFTNTLPVRRLDLGVGEATELTVTYVSVPDLGLDADVQRYTCLEPVDETGGRYRYDAVGGDFSAELEVDADGLVVEYTGLFTQSDPP